jgi:arsenate reductase
MAKPVVLFLCTGNSARSQMAEALLRKHASEHFDAHSAGTFPKGLHPLTIRVMDEIGIDMTGQRSKDLKEYLGRLPVKVLIIVCTNAEKTCPAIWPGVLSRLSWSFQDPAACQGSDEEKLAQFRAVRDQIDQKIQEWLAQLKLPRETVPA